MLGCSELIINDFFFLMDVCGATYMVLGSTGRMGSSDPWMLLFTAHTNRVNGRIALQPKIYGKILARLLEDISVDKELEYIWRSKLSIDL